MSSFLSFIARSFVHCVEPAQLWSRRKRRNYANLASTPRCDHHEDSQGICLANLHEPLFAVSELFFQIKRIVRHHFFGFEWLNAMFGHVLQVVFVPIEHSLVVSWRQSYVSTRKGAVIESTREISSLIVNTL
jgi:hypothetical protein